jgi:hypothetical protein
MDAEQQKGEQHHGVEEAGGTRLGEHAPRTQTWTAANVHGIRLTTSLDSEFDGAGM